MGIATLAAFVALELTLCLIPGPAVLLTISTTLRRGLRTGLLAAVGILAGNTTYFVLSGLGVVALLLASYQAFTVVKWAGAAYLAYLGLRSLFAREHPLASASPESGDGAHGRALVAGFVTQIANPKAIVFFVSILPQFVDPRGSIPLQLAILTLAGIVVEFSVLSSYATVAERLRRSDLAGRASLWIERAGGAVLLWIASRIAREPLAHLP